MQWQTLLSCCIVVTTGSLTTAQSTTDEYEWVQKSKHVVEMPLTKMLFLSDINQSENPVFLGPVGPNGENLTAYAIPLKQWIVGAAASTMPTVPWDPMFDPLNQATVQHIVNLSTLTVPKWSKIEVNAVLLRSVGAQEFDLFPVIRIPGDTSPPIVSVKRDRDWETFVEIKRFVYEVSHPPADPPPPGGPGGV